MPFALPYEPSISSWIPDPFFSFLTNLYAKTIFLVTHYVLVILSPIFSCALACGCRSLARGRFAVALVAA